MPLCHCEGRDAVQRCLDRAKRPGDVFCPQGRRVIAHFLQKRQRNHVFFFKGSDRQSPQCNHMPETPQPAAHIARQRADIGAFPALGKEDCVTGIRHFFQRQGADVDFPRFDFDRLAIARKISDRRGEGKALGNLGTTLARLGEVRKATDYYEQALTIAREIGDPMIESAVMAGMKAMRPDHS